MARFKSRTFLGVLLVLALVFVLRASAATIDVPADQPTIQAAIDAAEPGDTILVHSGTYPEDLTVDKKLTLEGGDVRYQVVIEGSLTITADGVVIDNFRITNPAGKHAITATDHSDLTITNNTIHDVGTEDASTSGSNWGIAIISDALPVDSVVIAGNTITNVVGGEGKSAHGIVVGWSDGVHDVTGLVIQENTITTVLSLQADGVSGGRGAYGVLINHAGPTHAGRTVDAVIRHNTITDVRGLWARGVGLEGDTPGALVEGNVIDDVRESDDHDSVAIGVFLEDNGDAGTVTVRSNSLTGVTWGVGAHPATSVGTVDASGNHFGGDIVVLNVSKVFGDMDYTPWLESGLDVSADPGFQGDFSTLWVAAASPQTGGLHRIEEALALLTGTRINLMPGVYVEQVWITIEDLQLVGSGPGGDPAVDSIIRSPAGQLPLSFSSPAVNRPVVGVIGCGGVQIRDLRIDGDGQGQDNVRFHGLAFWNADGALEDCTVVGVRNTPLSGAQHGVGVWAHNDTGGPYAIALTRVRVEDFQKNGFSLSGEGLTVALQDMTAIGAGPTGVIGQNGVQISQGAGGAIDGCAIRDIDYTGPDWTATGLLVLQAEPVHVQGAIIEDCQTGAIWEEASGSFTGGEITGIVYDGLRATSFAAKDEAGRRRAGPQPLLEEGAGGRPRTPMSMHVEDSRFHGVAGGDVWGVYGWTGDALVFTIVDSEVKDCSHGIAFVDDGGAVYDARVENSAIHGNADFGLYSDAAQAIQATCNWWGDIGGPDAAGNANPAGDAITGDVLYWPWLAAYPGPGVPCNQFPAENVSVQDAEQCLTPGNPCAELAVAFNRDDDTPVGGISVTFELSEELTLCDTPENSIAAYVGEGSWLGAYGNHTFHVYADGAGSYTADLAILGQPCGPTGSGVVFTVEVARAAHVTSDAVGTVTVTDVLVRGCANEPLPGIPGAPGQVAIDLTEPDPLQDLVAVQQKSGNPSGGTTNILLSWTAPDPLGDAAWIHIWRKGFGFYPEYDDAGGAAPTPPVSAANGWQHAATVAATESGHVDLAPARDFFYYAAFVEDGCGNLSAVSDLTAGTLNYHLGDVSDGLTPGSGDNQVGTVDVSLLGMHYGALLGPGDPLYHLDVGPTTDSSVDARPTTDGAVNFEDLMMFAINYGQVSKGELPAPQPVGFNELVLAPGAPGAIGEVFDVALRLSGDGRIQALSVPLTWDAAVVEPVGVRAGELLAAQGGLGMVLSPDPGTVDAALFGVRDQGLSGEGVLAVASFRVKSAGDPRIGLGAITARDARNQAIHLHGAVSGDVPGSLPHISMLTGAMPNPFNPSTELSFAIAREGAVKLSVYSLRGRLVRTLAHGPMSVGRYTVTWNGTDAAGRTVASGGYIVRLEAPDRTQSRRIMLVK